MSLNDVIVAIILVVVAALIVTISMIEYKCPQGYAPSPADTLYNPETGEVIR